MSPSNNKKILVLLAAATVIGATAFSPSALAGPFTIGDLVVLREGAGSVALSSASNAIFVDEFNTTGLGQTPLNTITITSTGASALTNAGSSTTEGYISLSKDGTKLTLAGYNIAAGTAAVAGTTGTVAPRSYGLVDTSGTYTFGANFGTSSFSAGNIRSTASDGSNAWGHGSNTGTVFGAGTVIQSTIINTRVTNIINNSLMFSTGAGTRGIYTFGSLPTVATAATIVFATGAASSPMDFAINAAGNIAYVADDNTFATGGGIQKWTFNGSVWTLAYTLSNGGTTGARGLAVDFSGANPIVYATTSDTLSKLIKITDTSSASTATVLATAGANTAYRGVEFAPSSGSIAVTVTPSSGDLAAASPAVVITITGGSATMAIGSTTGLGWSTTGLTNGSFSTTQNLNTIANPAGRLNGTMRGRTAFTVSGATTGNGTYSYTLSNTVSGEFVGPGPGITFGATQSSTLLLGDKYTGQNSVEGAGGLGKVATLVDSTALGGDSNVTLKWRSRSLFETYPGSSPPLPPNISSLITDVVNVDLGANAPSAYVMQMSYDPANLGGVSEADSFAAGHLYLAHMTGEIFAPNIDTGDGQPEDRWQNATDDSGSPQLGILGPYSASYLSTIGSWGVDSINHVAWAVLPSSEQGQFAVVPEPASLSLLALGALGLLRRKR